MSAIAGVSEIFVPEQWDVVPGFVDLTDLTYHRAKAHGTVRIAFDRPDVLNAFRPHTVDELLRVLEHARTSSDVGCVLLTGNGPSEKNGKWAFCTGGDQRIRGRAGYQYADGETADTVDKARLGRLHILECQRLIRFMPKVVICLVPGWTAGGGHSLHVVCDLTIASREHARFKQTDADVGSFDGGFGSAYLARQVGQKFAREIFFLGQEYSAEVLLQPHRRRPGRPTALRRRDHPPGLHDRRGPGGTRPVPREARPGLVAVPLVLLSRCICAGAFYVSISRCPVPPGMSVGSVVKARRTAL
jgi:naphthoate synthase